jgi:N-acetylglucosamine-6-phosphate deacetylase
MPRVARERPKKTLLAAFAVFVVLGIGWLAGGGVAGSTPRLQPQVRTVVSVETVPVIRTVTVAAQPPRRAMNARQGRTGRKRGATQHNHR